MKTAPKFETLQLEFDKAVATLWLNRPHARNALNMQMCRDIVSACVYLGEDLDTRLVFVRARGVAFCAGADLKERKGMEKTEVLARRVEGFTAYSALESLAQPIIAVVHGATFGSGAEIAAACDFILASEDTVFKYPEVGWGTVGATQRLPRALGARMAKELLFTGRGIEAAEAKQLGLVNHVYRRDDLDKHLSEMAQAIVEADPLTVRLTKKSINNGMDMSREGAMGVELMAIQQNLRQAHWKNSIETFGSVG